MSSPASPTIPGHDNGSVACSPSNRPMPFCRWCGRSRPTWWSWPAKSSSAGSGWPCSQSGRPDDQRDPYSEELSQIEEELDKDQVALAGLRRRAARVGRRAQERRRAGRFSRHDGRPAGVSVLEAGRAGSSALARPGSRLSAAASRWSPAASPAAATRMRAGHPPRLLPDGGLSLPACPTALFSA